MNPTPPLPRIPRREFLSRVAAVLAIDPIRRVRPGRLKLSLSAYSFRDYLKLDAPRMDMFQFVDLAADYGCDAVEPTSYWFPPDVDDAYLRRLQQHAFLQGLDISGTAIRNDLCLADPAARAQQLETIRRWIDRASVLTAPVIRIFGGNVPRGDSEDAAAERVISAIEELLPHAVARGVTLALENHGGITDTPAQLLRIVRAVRAPEGGFGVNLDTGNFHGDDPYADVAALAPYAVNVQVKTEIRRGQGPKEPADLERMIAILRDARYAGYVVLEYEADEDPMIGVPAALRILRPLMG
ncbi:MAG: xylose isomerase [Isosphaeraceae bacterium]|jgi:sugar phosphate isomerase/epimerase|nr:MAG: xylose isomerase [Isosphaeraceae bacterium]